MSLDTEDEVYLISKKIKTNLVDYCWHGHRRRRPAGMHDFLAREDAVVARLVKLSTRKTN